MSCAAAVQSGSRSLIEVQGAIVCSGANACRVDIQRRGVTVTIRGAPGSSIRRIDHYDYPLLYVHSVPDSRAAVVLSDLTIDEGPDIDCLPVSRTNPPVENFACGRSIDIFGITEVTIDHVTVAGAKSTAVSLSTVGKLRISHARLIAPRQFGLAVYGASPLTGGLTVEDTVFWGAASNAMVLADAHGTAQAPVLIRNTLFDNNHRDDLYYMCGPRGDEKCGGGQLIIPHKVDSLRVEHTVIRNGPTDPGEHRLAGGVEIGERIAGVDPEVHDIAFVDDDIHSHGMWGVYAATTEVARVSFMNSKLYDNGKYPGYRGVDIGNVSPGVVTESGTCHAPGCTTVRLGALWALPGGGVWWLTNDASAPRVTVNGTAVSSAANGQITAAAGSEVVLSDGATALDRLTVPCLTVSCSIGSTSNLPSATTPPAPSVAAAPPPTLPTTPAPTAAPPEAPTLARAPTIAPSTTNPPTVPPTIEHARTHG